MRSGVPTGYWPAGWPTWMLTPTRRPSSWWPSCCVGPAPDRVLVGLIGRQLDSYIPLATARDHRRGPLGSRSRPKRPGGVAVREARSALDASCEGTAPSPNQLQHRAHPLGALRHEAWGGALLRVA